MRIVHQKLAIQPIYGVIYIYTYFCIDMDYLVDIYMIPICYQNSEDKAWKRCFDLFSGLEFVHGFTWCNLM